MTGAYQPEEIPIDNERSLKKLIRSITNSQGNFVLIIARCNYRSLQDQIVQRLKQECPVSIRELHLSKSIKTLFTVIQADLGDECPQALMVFGLELVDAVDQILISTNQVREEFRKNFAFPIVLWVNDEIFQKLIRLMPDFKNWTGNSIKFEIALEQLINNLRSFANSIFTAILEIGAGRFLDNASLNIDQDAYYFLEVGSAVESLLFSSQSLDPELKASLQFLLGREADANGKKAQARDYYEQSLSYWQQKVTNQENIQSEDVKRYGCVVWHLGLWWRQYATMHRSEYREACLEAKKYFQNCVEIFEQNNFPDLAAKYINAWGEVLARLEIWDELEKVANLAIDLHKTYLEQIRLAYSYGLMAEVNLKKSEWVQAKEYAELALQTNDIIKGQGNIPAIKASIRDWEQKHHRNFYLLLLAEAQQHLNQVTEGIIHLETARSHSNPQSDPLLYIRILANLQKLYFDQGKYLEAFNTKQEQRSIEQQYGLRAFVGAGRLQSRRQVINPGLAGVADSKTAVTQEIAASGRLQDVNRLIERIGRPDHKLTVIYGQSGVGKSSLVQAGLLPALKQRSVEARDVVPVLLQVYTDWVKNLGSRFVESIKEVRGLSFPHFLDSMAAFTQELRKNVDSNFLTVLIFDQFEEFFFAYKDPTQRLPFFEFIRDCLNIPYVKIILSLREDYLHYLLECNRLAKLDAIDSNILDKKILYHLGNFSPEDARSVIKSLTESSQFYLEPPLIDELVRDLASNLNEVRPIELQVVGAQLQTEKITTLAQYLERGPKEELVGHFLEEVVKDCGHNNEQFAKLVLYILTDENNTRPLKTRAELEADLALEPERLDLILKILVKSGLVFQVPGFPADRYQLVHDYLVPFVRQQQSERLIKELEKEREQRKITEAKLNEVLRQQLLEERKGLIWKASLGAIAGGLAIFLPFIWINQNNAQLISISNKSQGLVRSNRDLEALVEALKAGKRLKQWWSIGVTPETKMQVVTALQDVVYTIRERNSLEGHNDTVTSVSYSSDGKMLASGSADGVVKIWNRNGTEIKTIRAHDKKITNVIFSPDNQKILSSSEDKTLKLWSLEGKELANLTGHKGEVTSSSFSPDGQKVISGSKNGEINFWTLDGKIIKSYPGHLASVTDAKISRDGKLIVSASLDKTVKLWGLNGQEIKTITNDTGMNDDFYPCVNFTYDNQTINSNFGYLWRRNGSFLSYFPDSAYSNIYDCNFTQEGSIMALSDSSYSTESEVKFLDIGTKHLIDKFNLKGHRNEVTTMSFSLAQEMFATGSEDKSVKLWSLGKKDFKLTSALITDVSFSPNSQIVASISEDDKTQLWQRDGLLLAKLPGINSKISFGIDSQTLASASQESIVELWHQNGNYINTLQGNVIPGSFSHDGQTIALAKDDNTVEIFSSEGKHIANLKGHKDNVYEISVSQDGKTFATRSQDKTIKLWQRDGTLITTFKDIVKVDVSLFTRFSLFNQGLEPSNFQSISLNSDGKILTVWNGDNTLKFWHRDGKLLKTVKPDEPIFVKFSHDRDIIAVNKYFINTGDELRNQIELWQNDGTFIKILRAKDKINNFSTIDFIPGKKIAVTRNLISIQFWSYDGRLLRTFVDKSQGMVNMQGYSPDFQTLVSFDGKNKLDILKPYGQLTTIQLKTKRLNIQSNTFKIFVSSDNQSIAIRTNVNTVELWRTDGTFIKNIQGYEDVVFERFRNNQEVIESSLPISFSEDGKIVAIRIKENEIELWDVNKQLDKKSVLQPKTINAKSNFISSIQPIPNSDKIAISGINDNVKLWQLPLQKSKKPQLMQNMQGHKSLITSIAISSDNKRITSASYDNTVKIWQSDGKLIYTFSRHNNNVNSVSFSPDGKLVASASDDKTVKIWQADDGRVIKEFKEHENGVTSVIFSPDGKLIASGSQDNTVKLWSLESKDNKSLNTLDAEEGVTNLSFSPDGKMIAVTSVSKVKLFNVNGSLLTTYERLGADDNASSGNAYFSPDGKSIAATSTEGVSVWKFDLDYLLKRGCNWADDYLKNNPKVKDSDRALCNDINR